MCAHTGLPRPIPKSSWLQAWRKGKARNWENCSLMHSNGGHGFINLLYLSCLARHRCKHSVKPRSSNTLIFQDNLVSTCHPLLISTYVSQSGRGLHDLPYAATVLTFGQAFGSLSKASAMAPVRLRPLIYWQLHSGRHPGNLRRLTRPWPIIATNQYWSHCERSR